MHGGLVPSLLIRHENAGGTEELQGAVVESPDATVLQVTVTYRTGQSQGWETCTESGP